MQDKHNTQQLLGALIQQPILLAQIDKYNIDITDFSSKFEKYIYAAIYGLYQGGASKISVVDISNYLQTNNTAYAMFKSMNGIEYVNDAIDFASPENFDYYYNKFKKIGLLNDLQRQGFDISQFYMENLADPRAEQINAEFETLTTNDITEKIKRQIIGLETKYSNAEEIVTQTALEGIDDIINGIGTHEDLGLPIQGDILNSVLGGARLGTLTVRSAGSGVGKTRAAVADACNLAYPIRYDSKACQWVRKGSAEKVLLIITEQSFAEVQKMMLAYLSDINESKFRFGVNDYEMGILRQARQVMEEYQDNITIVRIPEPTVTTLKTNIREQVLTRNISYVFMDYIFISTALVSEYRGMALRNDELLLFLTTALKNLAQELNICIFSATQVNSNADNHAVLNESAIAGARSIINKADNGIIMSRPSPEELNMIQPLISNGLQEPNMITDVYKNRSGNYTNVRIWSYVDNGTMKREDLFMTDTRMNPIGNFEDLPIIRTENFEDEDLEKIGRLLGTLNA